MSEDREGEEEVEKNYFSIPYFYSKFFPPSAPPAPSAYPASPAPSTPSAHQKKAKCLTYA